LPRAEDLDATTDAMAIVAARSLIVDKTGQSRAFELWNGCGLIHKESLAAVPVRYSSG
jgi:hypothetical protein